MNTGVVSVELGASGLAIVSLPMENGASNEMDEERSTSRGSRGLSLGLTVATLSMDGGGTRFEMTDCGFSGAAGGSNASRR